MPNLLRRGSSSANFIELLSLCITYLSEVNYLMRFVRSKPDKVSKLSLLFCN